jgi:hypothetical protein
MQQAVVVQILFGWPAIIACILLSVAGVWQRKPGLLIACGILVLPFTYYLSGAFHSPAVLLPVCIFGAAYAVKHQRTLISWLLVSPLLVVSLILAYAVLTQ